jgi:hypothetical protein
LIDMSLSGTLSARVLGVSTIGLPLPAPNRWTAKIKSAVGQVCAPLTSCWWQCYFYGTTSLTLSTSVSDPQGTFNYTILFPGFNCNQGVGSYVSLMKYVNGSGATYNVPFNTNGMIVPDDNLLIWAAAGNSIIEGTFTGELFHPWVGYIYAWTKPADVPFERKVEFPMVRRATCSEVSFIGYGPMFFNVTTSAPFSVMLLDIGIESPFEQEVELLILGPRGNYTRQYFRGTAKVPKGDSDIYLAVATDLGSFTLVVWPQLYFSLNSAGDRYIIDNTNETIPAGTCDFPIYMRYIKVLSLPPLPTEIVDQLIEYIHSL